jgi:hypothetical protein
MEAKLMRLTRQLQILISGLMFMLAPLAAVGEDRGRMLYQNHCVACHESTVHIREARKVRTYADLENFSRRFAKLAGVEWTDNDMILVIEYLNRTHYKLEQIP